LNAFWRRFPRRRTTGREAMNEQEQNHLAIRRKGIEAMQRRLAVPFSKWTVGRRDEALAAIQEIIGETYQDTLDAFLAMCQIAGTAYSGPKPDPGQPHVYVVRHTREDGELVPIEDEPKEELWASRFLGSVLSDDGPNARALWDVFVENMNPAERGSAVYALFAATASIVAKEFYTAFSKGEIK
jgi:hypothetical protein